MNRPQAPQPGGRQRRPAYVTTSWDDGHVLDIRLAEMLTSNGLAGTFYIAPENIEHPASRRLGETDLCDLTTRFEIGGHGLTHRRLTMLSLDEAGCEVRDGKARLEQVIQRPVTSFCYPGGRYRTEHIALVRAAGFRCARTVRRLSTAPVTDPFTMHTTVQARPHPRDWPRLAVLNDFRPTQSIRCFDWAALAEHLFDRVLAGGGVFHLWGHSWEVDRLGQWGRLARVLAHIGNRRDVRYVANGNLPGVPPAGQEAWP